MLMRYHIGLGIGHVYAQRRASSGMDHETAGYATHGDDMEEVCVFEIPDNDDDNSSGSEVDFCSEHSSESSDDREDEEGDEEFLVDEEDLDGY
jgi:hypothetical protein